MRRAFKAVFALIRSAWAFPDMLLRPADMVRLFIEAGADTLGSICIARANAEFIVHAPEIHAPRFLEEGQPLRTPSSLCLCHWY